MPEPDSPRIARGLEILAATAAQSRRQGREDLAERAEEAARRLADPALTVLVVGEFKQGKSSLVNALLNADISPVDDDLATSVPLLVRHAEAETALVVQENPEDRDETFERPVPFAEIGSWVSELTNPGNHLGVRLARVGVPRQLLAGGLELVDTPGVGGLASAHGRSTLAALPLAEATVVVTDASQELTASELEFLRLALDRCPNVVIVMTKIDLYPEWRRIRELNQGHLRAAGVEVPILAVSTTLRRAAVQRSDRDLNTESGFPALVRYLREQVMGDAEQTALAAAAADVEVVVTQLRRGLEAEKAAIDDPERTAELTAELQAAKDRADRLRTAAARWQVTLNDGIADLTADIDHDLRARTRTIINDMEEAIDAGEPAEMADELPGLLETRVIEDVAANYELLARRAAELADRVEQHFADDAGGDVGDPQVIGPDGALAELGSAAFEIDGKPTAGQTLLTGMRASYGGVLMFGMLGGLIGLATFGPLSLGAGLLMGRKGAKEEGKRQLTMRRQQAKHGVRKYVDDVSFRVGKHSRDSLRSVQRQIRDRTVARATELQTTANAALEAAKGAVNADASTTKQRRAEIEKALDHLARVQKATNELLAQGAA